MVFQQTQHDYNTYDTRYHGTYNRPCIDGSITSCGKCVAYCSFFGHPGFITENLRKKHSCMEKGCIYYLPKPQKAPKPTQRTKEAEKQIVSVASLETSDMEGLRVMRATQEKDGSWVIYYIAVADYFLDVVAERVANHIGRNVQFTKLEYRFEVAASIIFNLKQTA